MIDAYGDARTFRWRVAGAVGRSPQGRWHPVCRRDQRSLPGTGLPAQVHEDGGDRGGEEQAGDDDVLVTSATPSSALNRRRKAPARRAAAVRQLGPRLSACARSRVRYQVDPYREGYRGA